LVIFAWFTIQASGLIGRWCFVKLVVSLLLFGLLFGCASGGSGPARNETFTNSRGLEFVLIPAGQFTNAWTSRNESGEEVQRRRVVTISKPFYLGKYEVTQAQWEAVMGQNPSRNKDITKPVETVSWADVRVFIQKSNKKEGGNKYRLPTEAEWEHAARAGTDTVWFWGNGLGDLGKYAWIKGHDNHPVGQKKPNPWGLYDIYGNVSEWVEDWFEEYQEGEVTDPAGPASGSFRVSRGGSWCYSAKVCGSAARSRLAPHYRGKFLGFRLAFSPSQ